VITAIFGLAPILTALQVRPGIILRPNETHTPGLGILQTIGLIIVVVLLIGLVVGQIISPTFGLSSSISPTAPYLYGIIGVAATLAFLGILTGVLWVIIWLVGKLPSFGNIELKLALKNLSSNRLRTATTLLALSAGMFALSSITFVGEGTRQLLNVQLTRSFGGNVLAFPVAPGGLNRSLNQLVENRLNSALQDVEGVESRTRIMIYQTEIVSIDGEEINIGFTPSSQDTEDGDGEGFFGAGDNDGADDDEEGFEPPDSSDGSFAAFTWAGLSQWDSEGIDIYDTIVTMRQGRNLTADDRGQRVLIGPAESANTLGIEVGSKIVYNLGGDQYEFEVIGLTDSGGGFLNTGGVIIPPETLGNNLPEFQLFSYTVEDENISEAVVELSSISLPRTFALDVSFIDQFISRLITQFAAIPTVVGLLSLFAAAIIMANTVALSTLERQRQIGILKALGLKSWRVLRIMLIESSIIGLLSAILGIGLSVIIVTLVTSQFNTTIPFPNDARLAALGLTVAAVVIGWFATFLSSNVAVRERVMNVLRYE
jgi:ABC-type antimicrobial peptide transport system permease subunit